MKNLTQYFRLQFKQTTQILLILTIFNFAYANPTETTLWQIGIHDNNYLELMPVQFELEGFWKQDNPIFSIGNDSKTFPFIQPGPIDAWAGKREHPLVIQFEAPPKDPNAWYEIVIDLVDVHATFVPSLRVRLNGREIMFSCVPGKGDVSLSDASNGVEQTFSFFIPGKVMTSGMQSLELCVIQGSWILYDTVKMRRIVDQPRPSILAIPLPCFKYDSTGSLKQVIDIRAWIPDYYETVEAISTIDDKSTNHLFEKPQLGIQHFELLIDPVDGAKDEPKQAQISMSFDGWTLDTLTTVTQQKKWKFYVLAQSHFDHGYTNLPSEVMKQRRIMLDRAMEMMDEYPDFIWNLEATYLALDYLEHGKHPDRFIKLVKQKRIGIQALFANMLTAACSSEELIRLADDADYLRKTYDIDISFAQINDVPSLTWGLPSALNSHGVFYLSHAVNSVHAAFDAQRPRPYYWESPDGSRVLYWYTGGYGQAGAFTDTQGDLRQTKEVVKWFVDQFENGDYPYDATLFHGAYSDNVDLEPLLIKTLHDWNQTYAYPQFIFSRGTEFFEYMETTYGKDFPVIRGDEGAWWEDGIGSSAVETGMYRSGRSALIAAEKLETILGPQYSSKVQFDHYWKNVFLYNEHTWGWHGSIDQPESTYTLQSWKEKFVFAQQAGYGSGSLYAMMQDLAKQLNVTRESLLVFNPSSWTRSEWVSAEGYRSLHRVDIEPLSLKIVPATPIENNLGTILDGPEPVVENQFYKLVFDSSGAIKSLYDKALNRDLIDAAQYRLGQYLYIRGGDKTQMEDGVYLGYRPVNDNDLRDEALAFVFPFYSKQAQLGTQIISASFHDKDRNLKSDEGNWVFMNVTLYDDVKRIDLEVILRKDQTYEKEAGYLAFPFAFTNPSIRLEIPGAVVRPELDQLPAGCREWYAVEQFAVISDDHAAVAIAPIESALMTVQDIFRGQWKKHIDIKNGLVFGYLFNNYWFTNYCASQGTALGDQRGCMRFKFSLTSAASITDADAKRFGESANLPLVTVKNKFQVKSNSTPEPLTSSIKSSFFTLTGSDHVLVQAIRNARFEQGFTVRLRNFLDTAQTVTFHSARPLKHAWLCDASEIRLQPDIALKPSETLSGMSGEVTLAPLATVTLFVVPEQ